MKSINTSQHIIIPKKWDTGLKSQELLENLNSISNEEISAISNEINENKEQKEEKERDENDEIIYWEVDELINNIKENFVEEKQWEYLWEKWKDIHVKLPAKWEFSWYETTFFISDSKFDKVDIELNKKIYESLTWAEQSDMWPLLKAIKKYLEANWIKTELVIPATNDWVETTVGHCLKKILWLDDYYRARNSQFKNWKFRFLRTDQEFYYTERSDWSEHLRLLLRKDYKFKK